MRFLEKIDLGPKGRTAALMGAGLLACIALKPHQSSTHEQVEKVAQTIAPNTPPSEEIIKKDAPPPQPLKKEALAKDPSQTEQTLLESETYGTVVNDFIEGGLFEESLKCTPGQKWGSWNLGELPACGSYTLANGKKILKFEVKMTCPGEENFGAYEFYFTDKDSKPFIHKEKARPDAVATKILQELDEDEGNFAPIANLDACVAEVK